MDHRPERIRIIHELGKPQSLLSGVDQFDTYGSGTDILLLGLGPDPSIAAAAVSEYASARRDSGRTTPVRYIECPDFARQMPAAWSAAIPATWQALSADQCNTDLLGNATVLVFRQNLRLFPSFWGPLLAAAQAHHLQIVRQTASTAPRGTGETDETDGSGASGASGNTGTSVILPGRHDGLLIRELASAFAAKGYTVRMVDPDSIAGALPALLAKDNTSLFFSVNGQGLDMFGERYHLMQAAGVPVVIWCVDTPWHIVSGFKAPFWKEAYLGTTDASFLPALQAAGAKRAFHLPLATDPAIFHPAAPSQETQHLQSLNSSVVFVGRSEFPERQKYFSGIIPDSSLVSEADTLLRKGERADYHWWAAQLGETSFWPDTPRRVGAGADESSRHWRSMCLHQALPCRLTVFGDVRWKHHIKGLEDLRPPVDYYSGLADIYRASAISLNITGLLLPGGLTQRHFDVWAAGGLLLTDANPGLDIFPAHLVDAIRFRRAEEIPARVNHLLANPFAADQLRTAWRNHILAHHTYRNRVHTVLTLLAKDGRN